MLAARGQQNTVTEIWSTLMYWAKSLIIFFYNCMSIYIKSHKVSKLQEIVLTAQNFCRVQSPAVFSAINYEKTEKILTCIFYITKQFFKNSFTFIHRIGLNRLALRHISTDPCPKNILWYRQMTLSSFIS